MKKGILLVLLLCTCAVKAQSEQEVQNEIDQAVWKPFQAAFENLDAEALNAIYAEEVLRVTPNGIDTKGNFREANVARFNKNKEAGLSIALDFWFDSRKTNVDTSYEVGFYRIGFTDKEGTTDFVYGQFHIVLKKRDGQWHIVQDWDTTAINGKVIGKKDFDKKMPLQFKEI